MSGSWCTSKEMGYFCSCHGFWRGVLDYIQYRIYKLRKLV